MKRKYNANKASQEFAILLCDNGYKIMGYRFNEQFIDFDIKKGDIDFEWRIWVENGKTNYSAELCYKVFNEAFVLQEGLRKNEKHFKGEVR